MPKRDTGNERDGGQIVAGQAVIAGRDAPPVLEMAEQALDPIAPPAGDAAVLLGYGPGGGRRDGGDHLAAFQPILRLCAS
jgi:hypothetical protein